MPLKLIEIKTGQTWHIEYYHEKYGYFICHNEQKTRIEIFYPHEVKLAKN